MKNIINFIIFVVYATLIFFLPNNELILICIFINLIIMLLIKINIKNMVNSLLYIMPFIIFTFIINWLLDNVENAIWIGVKLIIVCNITIIYSNTTTTVRNSRNYKIIMHTIKNF